MAQTLGKTIWQSLSKFDIFLPYDPTATFLGIDPKESNTSVHTKTCVWCLL